jgi:hypothetical protein
MIKADEGFEVFKAFESPLLFFALARGRYNISKFAVGIFAMINIKENCSFCILKIEKHSIAASDSKRECIWKFSHFLKL